MNQIQIISDPEELQQYFDIALDKALKRYTGFKVGEVNPEAEKPVNTKDICEFLDVTEPTLIRWRNKGKIPFLQIGSRILYQKSAVLKALKNQEQ